MAFLRFLANMNISPKTVAALRLKGWDVIRVSEVLPANTPDNIILDFAQRENRTLVTQDLDFSTLLALQGYEKPSVITMRLSKSDPETISNKIISILPKVEKRLQEGCVIIVEDNDIRVRNLPI